MKSLIEKIKEARRLELTGEALLQFLGVKVAGIGEKITFVHYKP